MELPIEVNHINFFSIKRQHEHIQKRPVLVKFLPFDQIN